MSGAVGINKYRTTPLLMLLDQPGKIRAYKVVTATLTGPSYPGLIYKQGKTLSVAEPCTDETVHCGAGINVATLDWCMREWYEGCKILILEFTKKDIAAIPIATDGKFRLFRAKVVGEVDLKEIGLVEDKPVRTTNE